MATNYHRKPLFQIRVDQKVIDDFTYLPGKTHVERFTRVVALGLKMAEREIDAPAKPSPSPVSDKVDKRALIDATLAQRTQPSALATSPGGKTLDDFSPEEIIQHIATWDRKTCVPLYALLKRLNVKNAWGFS